MDQRETEYSDSLHSNKATHAHIQHKHVDANLKQKKAARISTARDPTAILPTDTTCAHSIECIIFYTHN